MMLAQPDIRVEGEGLIQALPLAEAIEEGNREPSPTIEFSCSLPSPARDRSISWRVFIVFPSLNS